MPVFPSSWNQQQLAVIYFSLFSGWLLSFLFEGPVFYALSAERQIESAVLNQAAIFAHFAGLVTAGFYVTSLARARVVLIAVPALGLAGTMVLLMLPGQMWLPVMAMMAYFAGWAISAWGYLGRCFFNGLDRLWSLADILIYSNILLLVAHVLANNATALVGLVFILTGLAANVALGRNLADESPAASALVLIPTERLRWPLAVFAAFIFVITLNSGIMYRVVYPAYEGFSGLISLYQVTPYIGAIWLVRRYANRMEYFHILYIGLALLGLAYVLFSILDRSASSFFVVNTFMMAAWGVNDLFWWTILGAAFHYVPNPAQLFGLGLGMNVLGVWCGSILGGILLATGQGQLLAAALALIIIFMAMFIIPVLNKKLGDLLGEHVFLQRMATVAVTAQENIFDKLKEEKQLTNREVEVVEQLLKGYTYKVISQQLYISENTLKTHVKNIYSKLNINSRVELFQIADSRHRDRELSG